MKNLSERLQYVLFHKKITQTEAAKRCGISQQSINYIIKNSIERSKLAHQIAAGLNVNPEWLINGIGGMESKCIYKIPVMFNFDYLQAFLKNIPISGVDFIHTDFLYGDKVFAYKVLDNKVAICSESDMEEMEYLNEEFLLISVDDCQVFPSRVDGAYRICEWRLYNVEHNKKHG